MAGSQSASTCICFPANACTTTSAASQQTSEYIYDRKLPCTWHEHYSINNVLWNLSIDDDAELSKHLRPLWEPENFDKWRHCLRALSSRDSTLVYNQLPLTFSQSIRVRGFSTGLGATFPSRNRHCRDRDRGKLEVFQRQGLETEGRHSKPVRVEQNQLGDSGKLLYPLRLLAGFFFSTFPTGRWSLC